EIHEGFRVTQRILSLPVGEVEVLTGNALVMSQDLAVLPEFIDDVSSFYNAKLLRTNFKDVARSTQFINDYVKKQTREMITDVVSGLSPDIRMVLLNYIYFR
ncbi:hypothetical protein NL500_28710, partial [Klebsiella pneumoniae]|nr:hypothetical protein [Klebsiella pneumoniae]